MSKLPYIRLIYDDSRQGSYNMACDELLFERLKSATSPPTLRFYDWTNPTISLGYFQKINEFDLTRIRKKQFDLVRRPTGGRGVLHWDEVTFCLTITAGNDGLWDIFRKIHESISYGLNLLHIPAKVLPAAKIDNEKKLRTASCFASPARYELTLGGKKVAGSAQKKDRDFLLIHGSIPIIPHFKELFETLVFPDEETRTKAYNQAMKKMTSIFDWTKKIYNEKELQQSIVKGFREKWDMELAKSLINTIEEEEIKSLIKEKYESDEWTFKY
jgi:lipoyl(octanoyl) transferase